MTLMRIALPLFLVASSAVSSVDGKEKLRWKFTAGEERTMQMTIESESSGVPGASSTTKTVTTMSWKVDDVDEHGSAHVSQKVQRVRMTMSLPGMEPLEYDSAVPDPDPNPILAASPNGVDLSSVRMFHG
jgi:hypothetical protein